MTGKTSQEKFAIFRLSPDDGKRWAVCDQTVDPVLAVAQFATLGDAMADAERRNVEFRYVSAIGVPGGQR